MTNIITIARPYAKAAFNFANKYNLLNQWFEFLEIFSTLIKNNFLLKAIDNDKMFKTNIINILKENLDKNFYNFITLILKNKKLIIIPEIFKQFKYIKNNYNNIKIANITLAYETNKNILNILKKNLENKFNCNIDININIDSKIIGGIIIKIEDTVIDNSIYGNLKKLKNILLLNKL